MSKASLLLFIVIFCKCNVSKNPLRNEIKLLQKGKIQDDTSYVYALPYQKNAGHFIIQGYFGSLSHKERAALDFTMKKGTKITAARAGVVIRVKEDGKRGGIRKKFRKEGNHIIIQHADGSRAGYWHLQHQGVLVNIGDTVKQGQVIGLSGKTGYAAMPHLHFIVWKFDKNGKWNQVPTRFLTTKGIKYLRGWKKYKRPDE